MKPLAYYFSSRSTPIPPAVEDWLDRLPVSTKFLFAVAILKTLEPAFVPVPTFADYLQEKRDEDHSAS
jgi:hypothetical protein